MNIEELFAGVGLVIDDHVFESKTDRIGSIVAELESKRIPLLKYDSVPDALGINYRNLSFALLDWELITVEDEGGNPIPGAEEAKNAELKKLVALLEDISTNCYLPIFIFSNTDKDAILDHLKKKKILIEGRELPIFIKNKSEIVTAGGSNVWSVIEEWLKSTPSIYIFKVWQNACAQAGVSLMKDLAVSKSWTKVLWKTSHEDNTEPCEEMADVITQNVFSRMQPLAFEEDIVNNENIADPSIGELQSILSAQRYTTQINREVSLTGDLYKCSGGKYFLNIRPACDCVDRDEQGATIYLIQGSKLSAGQKKDKFDRSCGNFMEQSNEAIVGPINDIFLAFRFQNLSIQSADAIKDKKVGRVLPPFLTHITEKFALYIQRQGLPRLPIKAVLTTEQIEELEREEAEEG